MIFVDRMIIKQSSTQFAPESVLLMKSQNQRGTKDSEKLKSAFWSRGYKQSSLFLLIMLLLILTGVSQKSTVEKNGTHLEEKSPKLPGCIIVGGRKCGTRALLEAIGLHPKINKVRYEVHFFDNDNKFARGLEWYRKKMPTTAEGQITLEKTPGYFTSRLAPERLFRMNPKVKVVLIVRDPVKRTVSDYTQVHYNKLAKNTTQRPFKELAFDTQGRLNLDYKPVRNSLYSLHFPSWLRFFPLNSSLLLIDGDRFIVDPLSQIRKLEHFLGLEQAVSDEQLYFNSTKGFFCFKKGSRCHCLGDSKGRKHVRIGKEVEKELRRQMKSFNEQFFRSIGHEYNW